MSDITSSLRRRLGPASADQPETAALATDAHPPIVGAVPPEAGGQNPQAEILDGVAHENSTSAAFAVTLDIAPVSLGERSASRAPCLSPPPDAPIQANSNSAEVNARLAQQGASTSSSSTSAHSASAEANRRATAQVAGEMVIVPEEERARAIERSAKIMDRYRRGREAFAVFPKRLVQAILDYIENGDIFDLLPFIRASEADQRKLLEQVNALLSRPVPRDQNLDRLVEDTIKLFLAQLALDQLGQDDDESSIAERLAAQSILGVAAPLPASVILGRGAEPTHEKRAADKAEQSARESVSASPSLLSDRPPPGAPSKANSNSAEVNERLRRQEARGEVDSNARSTNGSLLTRELPPDKSVLSSLTWEERARVYAYVGDCIRDFVGRSYSQFFPQGFLQTYSNYTQLMNSETLLRFSPREEAIALIDRLLLQPLKPGQSLEALIESALRSFFAQKVLRMIESRPQLKIVKLVSQTYRGGPEFQRQLINLALRIYKEKDHLDEDTAIREAVADAYRDLALRHAPLPKEKPTA